MNAIQQGSLSGIGNYLLSLKPVIQKNADRIASHAGSREPKVTQQQLTSAPWLLPDSKETDSGFDCRSYHKEQFKYERHQV